MKTEEARSKTDSELEFELGNMKKNLFDLRFKSATESLTKPSQINTLRRDIARVTTILHERVTGVRGQESK